jgi:hypothetical protein
MNARSNVFVYGLVRIAVGNSEYLDTHRHTHTHTHTLYIYIYYKPEGE